MSLTTLKPVVLANDDFVGPELNSPYNGGGTDEFNSSQTFGKSVYRERVSTTVAVLNEIVSSAFTTLREVLGVRVDRRP